MNLKEFKKHVNNIQQKELDQLRDIVLSYKKTILIGNGGSNSIASHIANDYTKVLKRQSLSFTDSSRLTCYMNDYGVSYAYSQFIKEFSDEDTLVILITSSGTSSNLFEAAKECVGRSIPFVILTGFNEDNLVRKTFSENSKMSIWIDSQSYAVVECLHEAYLHGIVDV